MNPGQPLATRLAPEEATRVEAEAGEILASVPARIWDGQSLPVPIEVIAREVYGLRVLLKSGEEMEEAAAHLDQGGGGVSGLLLCGIGEIWVNLWESEQTWGNPRTRFTVGHELGHFVMHQAEPRGIYCRATGEDDQPESGLEPVPRPIPEVEANTFSAALLMPGDLVRPRLSGADTDVARVESEFQVSRKASLRRLAELRRLG